MTTITNPTPKQTATKHTAACILPTLADEQTRAIGLLIKALNDDAAEWDWDGSDGLNASDGEKERVDRDGELGRNPWVLAYLRADSSDNALVVEVNAEGLICAYDYEGYAEGRAWRRVDGADVTGILRAAWRSEFGN